MKVSEKVVSQRAARALRTHRVEVGQTLGGIAKRYQTTVQSLREFNGLHGDHVRAGTLLRIPGLSATAAAAD